jgi:N6-L-threonylcarbamoyladenine synthase
MTARLRDMRLEDLATVSSIESATFPTPWSHGVFLEELMAPGRAWLVVEDGDEILGYGGVMLVEEDAHVMNLAVRTDARGHGVGRTLLRGLLRRAATMGAMRATLEVRESNLGAVSLYESEGLHAVGIRPGYYADTNEDAVIMWGDLDFAEEPAAEPAWGGGASRKIVLAIETSCDETAAAVMRGGTELLANVVASQVDFHARFGGVVPEIASRKHTEAIVGVVEEALAQAGEALSLGRPLRFEEMDALAVTYGPGLVGALVVGLAYAKGLSFATGLPLVGVNHLEGHIFANVIADPQVQPPLVALVVSGGHTSLVHMPEWGVYRTMGETLDDAAGEAFDKVAKVLGLGYPGGPILSKLAEDGDPAAIDFPRAMLHSGDYAFSLSGLKTAVLNHIRHERDAGRDIDVPDLAASFQAAVIDVQVTKAVRAVRETGARTFCLAGGVAANPALRAALVSAMEALGVHVSVPPIALCTDNAAMIAAAAHYRFQRGDFLGIESEADPALRLDT